VSCVVTLASSEGHRGHTVSVGNTVNVAADPEASAMGPDVWSEGARASAASAVRDGIVSRRELLERLEAAGLVTVVSASAGSVKTVLLRSWISAAGLAERAGWVSVPGGERDGQRFWLSVLDALRQTRPGSTC
jgi:hypothetical protein